MARIHATAVSFQGFGVLLRGPSGAGKSDLALRLIAAGAELVADDQVELEAIGGQLIASAPETIAGLIEMRGLGIKSLPFLPSTPLALIVDLAAPEAIERLPEPAADTLEGVALPQLTLSPFEASAPLKIMAALGTFIPKTDAAVSGVHRTLGYKTNVMSEIAFWGQGNAEPLDRPDSRVRLLLVTGMSGAGRSSSLKILEDLGYEAVDNLPLSLIHRLTGTEGARLKPLAVGIDIRTRDFAVHDLLNEIDELRRGDAVAVSLVFLDCEDETLARRFTETRRRHPLTGDRPVRDGIQLERERLAALRDKADVLLDTTGLRLGDLKRVLSGYFLLDDRPPLSVFVTSFSFREGLPREADLVFDVRFLENPHYDADLRPLTGQDTAVADFIEQDPGFSGFWQALTTLLRPLLPRYDHEGKSYLTIAIGCTGGRHRSVFVAEKLARWIALEGQAVTLTHRELGRPSTLHQPGKSYAGATPRLNEQAIEETPA